MTDRPPFRQRPKLHLALTHMTGSPRGFYQSTPSSTPSTTPFRTPVRTPSGTPLATTSYSPLASAALKAPSPYGSPVSFRPRRKSNSYYGRNKRVPLKRLLSSKPACLLLMVAALALWWFNGGRKELDVVKISASDLGRDLLRERRMQDYQFFPATNPKIHYIGRWTSTSNRLRKDGTFPGVYFDIIVNDTSSLFIALHNAAQPATSSSAVSSPETSKASSPSHLGHLSFRPTAADGRPAPPVSLLAQVDDDEYVILPDSSSLVSVCSKNLDVNREHRIRIIAPMIKDHSQSVIELEGLWLSKGGKLVKVPGSLLSEEFADEDLLGAKSDLIGEKHRVGLNDLDQRGSGGAENPTVVEDDEDLLSANRERKKLVEIVTDSPGAYTGKRPGKRTGGADGLFKGVLGWEYLLGEMFEVDHVSIGVDGMCLSQDCIGGNGYPAGIGDVFFRSGPFGSAYFEHPWLFSAYIPDILVLNLGASDHASFQEYTTDYNSTMWDLTERFESTYVSLVKAIRRLAYPKHPSIVQSERLGYPGIIPSNTPASIPIFIMRPLRGQLEEATQNVFAKLRADGDKSVFWVDTSGWLDLDQESEQFVDFVLDDSMQPSRWRLTEQGNQRVAIFLHTHVCRYLAGAEEKCPFLPPEVYQGKVFDPDEANFDRFLEREKERKLKEMFVENGENEAIPA